MKQLSKLFFLSILFLGGASITKAQKQWTLKDCISHAEENNISLRKSRVAEKTSESELKAAKSGLLPTLSASMSQGVNYRPFQESSGNYVNGGMASSTNSKVTQNGSYGINASWTVWNGGINTKTVQYKQLTGQQAELSTQESLNQLKEQIAQLYIQILYSTEALKVNEELLKNDEIEYNRAKEMLAQGQFSRSDVSQLEAQVSSGQYNVVNARTTIANYKLQLKLLLELGGTEDFDIAPLTDVDAASIAAIPNKEEVYQAALQHRPEIKNAELGIEASKVNIGIAKAGYFPSISLSGGFSDSHLTGSEKNYFDQMKQNLTGNIGLSVSIPIIDGRKNKTSVEKAKLEYMNSQLDLLDKRKELLNSIETYWLNAVNYQQKYKASLATVKSNEESYELISERFKQGLKNIVELQNSRNTLLSAKQDLLQNKYTTLLNIQLLKFYSGEEISL